MRKYIIGLIMCMVMMLFAASAYATPAKICVPEKASKEVETPNEAGNCVAKYSGYYVPTKEEEEVLQHMKYVAEGVDKKPTIEFSNVNIKIPTNTHGYGNIVDGEVAEVTGDNDIVLGTGNTVTESYDLVAGEDNKVKGNYSLVTGLENEDIFPSEFDAILSGEQNKAENSFDSFLGGVGSKETAGDSTIAGGKFDSDESVYGFVAGGKANEAEGKEFGTVVGGNENTAGDKENSYDSIFGGSENGAYAKYGTIVGSINSYMEVKAEGAAIFGGVGGLVEGKFGSIHGGHEGRAKGEYSATLAGNGTTATETYEGKVG
jgi:hypothetical protein